MNKCPDLWGWAAAAGVAVAVWWAPSSGLCDAILALAGLAGLVRWGRIKAAWGSVAGGLFLASAAWLALSAAWSFWPAGSLRDLSKCIPPALAAAGLPGWLGDDGKALRYGLWASAAAVTARLAFNLAGLAATRGFPAVFAEARFAEGFLWTHPNAASVMACLAAVAWLGLLPRAKPGWGRWASAAGAAMCGAYVLVLGSRGPQAVFAGAVLLWPAAWLPGWKAKLTALVVAAALGWGLWKGAAALNPRFAETKTMHGANRRSDIWKHARMLAGERPWAGWGYGKKAFSRLVYDNPEQRAPDVPVVFPHAHSLWLMLYVEGGVPAFALGAAAWAAWLAGLAGAARRAGAGKAGWRARMAARSEPVLLGMMALMVLAYGVADCPDSAVRTALWLLAGTGLGVAGGSRRGRNALRSSRGISRGSVGGGRAE